MAGNQRNKYRQLCIERSNGVDAFATVGIVPARNVSGNNTYTFADNNAFATAAIQYYRLKVIDKDARFVYSAVIKLNNKQINPLSVFPNPAKDIVTISSSKKQDAVIVNTTGQLINKIQLVNGSQTIKVSGWASGIYFIKTTDEIIKLIKQ